MKHIALPRTGLLGEIRTAADAEGCRVFLVGGPVRDRLMGRPSKDLDLAVEGPITGLVSALAQTLSGQASFFEQFGTATLVLAGTRVDFARTRSETYSEPGALPAVSWAGIADDLMRRDFSVNAIAIALNGPGAGTLVDPAGGEPDIRRRRIRVLHDASFIDDPTRILRAVRFAHRLGFRLDAHTAELLMRSRRRVDDLSGERILNELRLIAGETRAPAILGDLVRRRILAGGLRRSDDFARGMRGLAGERAVLFVLAQCTIRLLDRLPLRNRDRAAIATVQRSSALVRALGRRQAPSRVYERLERESASGLEVLTAVLPARPARLVRRYLDEWRGARPELSGADLERMGLVPGPQFRRILRRLLLARLDGRVRDRAGEEALVRRGRGR